MIDSPDKRSKPRLPRFYLKNTERHTNLSIKIFWRCIGGIGRKKFMDSLIDDHPTWGFTDTSVDTYDVWLMFCDILTSQQTQKCIIFLQQILFHTGEQNTLGATIRPTHATQGSKNYSLSSYIIVIMTANGTPITTPTKPSTNPPNNTHKKITIGLSPSVLFMT